MSEQSEIEDFVRLHAQRENAGPLRLHLASGSFVEGQVMWNSSTSTDHPIGLIYPSQDGLAWYGTGSHLGRMGRVVGVELAPAADIQTPEVTIERLDPVQIDTHEAMSLVHEIMRTTVTAVRCIAMESGRPIGPRNVTRLDNAEALLASLGKLIDGPSAVDGTRVAEWVRKSEYDHVVAQLAEARHACGDVTAGPWIWMDTADDDLPTMVDGAVVSITAGQLRALLDRDAGETATEHARVAEALGLVESVTTDDILRVIASRRVEERGAVSRLASHCPEADPSELSLADVVNLLEYEVLNDISDYGWLDVEKILAYDADRSEPATDDIRLCLRSIEDKPHRAPLYLADLVRSAKAADSIAAQPTDEWTDATSPIVGTWVGRDIELTAAHAAPWRAKLVAVFEDEIMIEYAGHQREGEAGVPARDFQMRERLEVRLVVEPTR